MDRIIHASVGTRPKVLRRDRASIWGVYVNEGPPGLSGQSRESWAVAIAVAEERRRYNIARSWLFIRIGGVLLLGLAAVISIAGIVGSR